MEFREEKRDLFTMPEEYNLAHCISADLKMGAGIAVEFERRFHLKDNMRPIHRPCYDTFLKNGYCIQVNNVFNLVTKARYFQKPTYESLREALIRMKQLSYVNNINRIAMPKIGCGLDRLEWERVRETIQEVFEDTDVEIVVCYK